MVELGADELATLRRMLEEHAGLDVPDERTGELAAVVRARLPFLGGEERLARYLARLAAPDGRELSRLAHALVVHETYFFRDRAQLEVIVERAIAERARARGRVRVLSAGAATGAEAYTIAIMLRERHPDLAAQVEIVGIDLAPAVIEAARRGRYPEWALRETPPEIVERWFARRGGAQEIRDDVRAAVHFEVRNVVAPDELFWAPGSFDVIVFRNVLMYFAPAAARAVVARIERALAEGGSLFLSHAESLRGLDTRLALVHDGEVFYYRKIDAPAPAPRLDAPVPPPAPPPAPRLALPSPAPPPPREALIRRAVALVEHGDLRDAEEACAEAQRADDLDPIPHYLTALCRDRAGDPAGAVRHDITAAYLDPTFAMPCMHLGLLAKRSGDLRAAHRELSRALARLAREDDARIGLMGGGLDRAALMRFCRAELSRGMAR